MRARSWIERYADEGIGFMVLDYTTAMVGYVSWIALSRGFRG